jgi:renalase
LHGKRMNHPETDTATVAIVGAGLAGLSCAQALAERGVDSVLFDKGRGAGGRCSTRQTGKLRFDYGAQYFTARDSRFETQLTDWRTRGIVAPYKPRLAVIREGSIERNESSIERWVGIPGMNALVRDLAASGTVHWNTRIESLERGPAGWKIRDTSAREWGSFPNLIIAVPAPQAVPLLELTPVLKQQAAVVYMHPCWTVMAVFSEPLELSFDAAFVHDSPLSWIARNSNKLEQPHGESWVIQAGAEWSAAHLEWESPEVGRQLMRAFARAVGPSLPEPVSIQTHRWRYAQADPSLDGHALWDPAQRIGACGDWCFGGRIEGAWLSGRAMAEQL